MSDFFQQFRDADNRRRDADSIRVGLERWRDSGFSPTQPAVAAPCGAFQEFVKAAQFVIPLQAYEAAFVGRAPDGTDRVLTDDSLVRLQGRQRRKELKRRGLSECNVFCALRGWTWDFDMSPNPDSCGLAILRDGRGCYFGDLNGLATVVTEELHRPRQERWWDMLREGDLLARVPPWKSE